MKFNRKLVILCILLIFFLLKLGYVFYCTDYRNYLTSDAGGYWERASRNYVNQPIEFSDWWVWPPFPHLLLAGYFRLLDLVGLFHNRLELTLSINVLMSVVGAYFVYRITQTITDRFKTALLTTLAYLCYYPNIYLDAFVLSEATGTFFFLYSLFLVVLQTQKSSLLGSSLAGLYTTLATACRPAHGINSLAIFSYLLLCQQPWKLKQKILVIFTLSFGISLAMVVGLNYNLSQSELRGISGGAGIKFFMQQCQVHSLIYQSESSFYYIEPPSTVDKPELGTFYADQPFHHQKYYFDLGKRCIQSNSNIWRENINSLKDLFFGILYPTYWSAKGIKILMPLSGWISFLSFLLSGLAVCLAYKTSRFYVCLLLIEIPLLQGIIFIFLNGERRYLYSVIATFFILSGYAVERLVQGSYASRMILMQYSLALLFVAVFSWQQGLFSDRRKPLHFSLNAVDQPVALGSPWNTPGYFKLFEPGIEIYTDQVVYPHHLEVSLDNNDTYCLEYWHNHQRLATQNIQPANLPQGGMAIYEIDTPIGVQTQGINEIKVLPIAGDGSYSLGHLKLN